ncbi:MAG TPA: hypothetical protein VGA37_07740 [Gemmatimonadales bacterium]
MRRPIGLLAFGLALVMLAASWAGGRRLTGAQVVTRETVTLALDSLWLDGVRPAAPIGHEAFEVTLTPGGAANSIVLRAGDADGFTFEATYTTRGPN